MRVLLEVSGCFADELVLGKEGKGWGGAGERGVFGLAGLSWFASVFSHI